MRGEEIRKSVDVLIVGAGISGLTTGFLLHRRGVDVRILEKENRPGGSILTRREGGYLVELGPNTVLNNAEIIDDLIEEAGLNGDRLTALPTAKKRFILKDNTLTPLPAGPVGFLTTSIFTWGAKFRLLKEPFISRGDGNESIATFVRRRLGEEFLTWAVGPFISGVYAGNAEKLSVKWATRKIYDLEEKYGGLIRGALAKRKGPQPAGGLLSFKSGLAALPRRLAETLGENLRLERAVTSVHAEGDGFRVETEGESTHCRRLIVTGDARQCADYLAPLGDTTPVREMPYAGVIVVSLGFKRDQVFHPLDGFGFLVPPHLGLPLLGCLFPTSLFPKRAPEGHLLLTAFLGGFNHPEVLDWDDEKSVKAAVETLNPLLGLSGEPDFIVTRRWRRAIPQYTLDHGDRIAWRDALHARYPNLFIQGNLFGGISVSDCIVNGAALAANLL